MFTLGKSGEKFNLDPKNKKGHFHCSENIHLLNQAEGTTGGHTATN